MTNPYAALLAKALDDAKVDTPAARETVYKHARDLLAMHLSPHDPSTAEKLDAELKQLDHAIETVEYALEEQTPRDDASDPATSRVEGSVPWDPDAPPAAPRPPSRAAERITRLIPPLRIGGLVLKVIGIMANPYFLLGSLIAGVYIGLYAKTLTALLAPVAELYIELLKMVLIPFMVSAIVVSFSRLFGDRASQRHLGPIFAVFLAGLTAVAAIGVFSSIWSVPGLHMTDTMRQALGQIINRSVYEVDLEIALNSPPATVEPAQVSFLDHIVPDNIFRALTLGDNLKILFFAIAFGVGLGSLQVNRGEGLRSALLSVYDVCTQLIAWVNMLLPVALCGMVAHQVGTVGTAELLAMLRFTIGFGLVATLVCVLSVACLAWGSRTGLAKTLAAIREPLLLAIATRSSVTCIPASMTSLIDKLGHDRTRVELLLPLGITLFRFGPVLYYAFTTVFVSQLYNIAISPFSYVFIVVGAVLTGVASAGTTGVLTISLLGTIFQPLGLPLEAALALLVTVDPVIDMFRTACIVLPNCAAVAVLQRRTGSQGHEAVAGPAEVADRAS